MPRLLWYAGGLWARPALQQYLQGRSRPILEIEFEKCDPPCAGAGRTFFRIASFNTLIRCSSRDLAPNQADLEKVRPALRRADRTLRVWLRGSQTCGNITVPRMKCSIVENTPASQKSILKLFPACQLPYRANIKKNTRN